MGPSVGASGYTQCSQGPYCTVTALCCQCIQPRNRGGTCLSPMVGSLRPRCHSDSAQWYDGQGSGGGTRFLPAAPGDPPGQPGYAEGHRPLYRNRTNKHIVPGAGLWYRGASCRTGLSCHIVTYEDPADTNVHAITRMGWSGPARTALRGQCPVL